MLRTPAGGPLTSQFDPRQLAQFEDLELKARYLVIGFLTGLHESPFRGFSVEFSDYRNYQPGDDLRHLDWRVYARTDRLCVKQFMQETNAHVYLICDTSASMAYRGSDAWGSKLECARLLGAALTWLVLRQDDAVGLLTVGNDHARPRFVRPSQTPGQFGIMLRHLEALQPSGGARLPQLLEYTARLVHRRSIILLFSDLLEPAESIEDHLKELRFRGHECLVFQVLDRDEVEFPFEKPSVFEDLESRARRRVSPRAARESYLTRFNDFMAAHREQLRDLEMSHCLVRTDQDPMEALAMFLVRRRQLR
jgi:uncharacterized protein (DUF58 family)